MRVAWSGAAHRDLVRLYAFLEPVNAAAARQVVTAILAGVDAIVANPRLGRQLEAYLPREVRRLVIGVYELRYELRGDELLIVRLFHNREDRGSEN